MKTAWITALALAAVPAAHAQSTIYKHVDDSGRVTYSNKPMKGGTVVDLEPLTTVPVAPVATARPVPNFVINAANGSNNAGTMSTRASEGRAELKPTAAIVTPVARTTLASVEPQVQKRRDEDRRRILQQELAREEESLTGVREALAKEQQNPALIAAVRAAQQATDPSPAQLAQFRQDIDKASGRIRGLQATVAEHEKNIEALRKELGAMKP